MISRNEYLYLKSRLAKRELVISEFELKSKLYSQWIELKSLPQEEYRKRVKAWSEYYKDVRNSPVGLLLKEMASLTRGSVGYELSSEKKQRIREIMAKSEAAKDETNRMLTKPPYEDPLFVEEKIGVYKTYVAETENMRRLVAEFLDVYEPQKESKFLDKGI